MTTTANLTSVNPSFHLGAGHCDIGQTQAVFQIGAGDCQLCRGISQVDVCKDGNIRSSVELLNSRGVSRVPEKRAKNEIVFESLRGVHGHDLHGFFIAFEPELTLLQIGAVFGALNFLGHPANNLVGLAAGFRREAG